MRTLRGVCPPLFHKPAPRRSRCGGIGYNTADRAGPGIAETGLSDALKDLKAARGITVSEIAPMDEPIGVGAETTAAFVGRALRGPLNQPVLIENFADFRRRFGGVWHRSSLGPAVEQFFEHGGRLAWVVRVANGARGAMLCLPAHHGVLVLRAIEPGSTERIRAAVDYDGIPDEDHAHFNLTIQRLAPHSGLVIDQEIFTRLSCHPLDRAYVGSALAASELAVPQLPLPAGRPLPTSDPGDRGDPGYVGHVQPGSDGSALTDYDLIGSAGAGIGLFALDQVDRFDLLHLPQPSRNADLGPAALLAAELYCRRRSAMLIMDPPACWQSGADAVAGIRDAGYASPNMLTYFPRLATRGADGTPPRAAGGAIAGLICKLDRLHGAWQAFDHTELAFNRRLVPAIDVDAELAGQLVREGVNVVAGLPSGQAVLRGSVTLARASQLDRQFARLPNRRLCLMMTRDIERATRWAVFEPNEPRLAERIQAQVHAYLSSLANAGAFAEDRFVVRCDAGLHAENVDPRRGVTILLTFQPAAADQQVSLTLHQTVSGCRVATTAFAPVQDRCA